MELPTTSCVLNVQNKQTPQRKIVYIYFIIFIDSLLPACYSSSRNRQFFVDSVSSGSSQTRPKCTVKQMTDSCARLQFRLRCQKNLPMHLHRLRFPFLHDKLHSSPNYQVFTLQCTGFFFALPDSESSCFAASCHASHDPFLVTCSKKPNARFAVAWFFLRKV